MSILQALQDFLEGYEGMELRPLGEILTDLTRAAPPSYSLAPAGGGTDTQDVVGNRYYTSRYHFFALECAGAVWVSITSVFFSQKLMSRQWKERMRPSNKGGSQPNHAK